MNLCIYFSLCAFCSLSNYSCSLCMREIKDIYKPHTIQIPYQIISNAIFSFWAKYHIAPQTVKSTFPVSASWVEKKSVCVQHDLICKLPKEMECIELEVNTLSDNVRFSSLKYLSHFLPGSNRSWLNED